MKQLKKIILFSLLMNYTSLYAQFSDGSGWANYAYLVRIFQENIKRYKQLKEMMRRAKTQEKLIKKINNGIDNARGLIEVLPVKDQRVLSSFRGLKDSVNQIYKIYGAIPHGSDAVLQTLHDKTIAESFGLANQVNYYTEKQEDNVRKIFRQSKGASPKGAVRITAQTNAQILHALNQLIKVNGQMLKLQGESLAISNKTDKDSARGFNKATKDLKKSMKSYKTDFQFPKF